MRQLAEGCPISAPVRNLSRHEGVSLERKNDMSNPQLPIPTSDQTPPLPPDGMPPQPIREPDPDLLPDEVPNPNPDENDEPLKQDGFRPERVFTSPKTETS